MGYKAKNFFMVRIPILSINEYKEIVCAEKKMSEQIQEFINNPIFMEGIEIASPDLYNKIEKAKVDGSVLFDKKIYSSLLKYATRAYSRTTPFGLFTGFGIGYFSEKTNMFVSQDSNYQKRARADMEWVNKMVSILENDFKFMTHIKLYSNDSTYLKGERLLNTYLLNQDMQGKGEENTVASVRVTKQLEYVLQLCAKGNEFGKTVIALQEYNSNVEKVVIEEYIKKLLQNGYLYSELRMQKSNIDPLRYIAKYVRRFETDKIKYSDINRIIDLIDQYNEGKIGDGEAQIRNIKLKMQEIASVKNYLQVDYKLKLQKENIGENVKNKCEEIVTALMDLGMCFSEPQHLQKYKKIFMEKYGVYREIPILELLDSDMGIGAPEGYLRPNQFKGSFGNFSNIRNEAKEKFKQMILSKVIYANYVGDESITITDQDIEKIKSWKNDKYAVEYPSSIDMNFMIFAEDITSLNSGKYKLAVGPNWGTNMAGRTLGRFSDMLKEKEKKLYDGLYREDKNLIEDEYILSEIVEEPSRGRLGNVILNENSAEYQTTIGCMKNMNVKQINVKDILVGIDRKTNNFYLKSKIYGKKIKYTSFNMLNPLLNSNVGRFIKEVSSIEILKFYQVMQTLAMDEFTYMPRVEYNNCILQPRIWRLSMDTLDMPKTYNEFKKNFSLWKRKWKLPNHVYQKKHDDIFIYDFNNDIQLEELFRSLKREKNILLTEYGKEKFWLENPSGEKFYSEFVFSFFREKKHGISKMDKKEIFAINSCISKNQAPEIEKENVRICGINEDGWLYFKLYCRELDAIITNEVLPFCKQWMEKGVIKQFYFIRYADPDIHIRLRIQMNDFKENTNNIICYTWLNNLSRNSKIKEYTINIYERELERYGGAIPFDYVEKFFCLDSMYITEVLSTKRTEEMNEQLVVMSNIFILNIFDNSYERQLNLFENYMTNLNNYKKEFKKSMKEYIMICKLLNDYIPLKKLKFKNSGGIDEVIQLLNSRNEMLKQYIIKLHELDKQGGLANTIDDIIFSILHMHCNRFRGNRIFETKTLELTYRCIYAYKNYIKNVEK